MSLFNELRRRKVFRVAVVYAAVAFVVLQAADIMLPRLGVPDWAMSMIVVLVVLGFPVALVLAWALELTPDGVRVTAAQPAATADGPIPSFLGRRTVVLAALLVAVGLGLGAGWFLSPAPASTGSPEDGVVSLAVLPFADMSAEQDQEYLGDGIAEELLNVLVRSADIAVASRTSSFTFKGQNLAIPAIAQALGVGHIVEGSVRRSGDRLRITAQLIDVRADRPLWSESFDRSAADIFQVQDEIAGAIASALRVRLARPDRPVAGTPNPEAYDLYLLGLYHWHQRTPEGLHRALDVFTAATERDPGYARAWAGLSLTYRNLPGYTDYDVATARTRARSAAERAVELDPRSAEARTALGGALWFARDIEGAQRELEHAISLDPTFATGHHWLGILHTIQGRLGEGEAALRRARVLDPASLPIQSYLGLNLDFQGRPDEALIEAEALLSRAPGYRNGLIQSFMYAARLGRAREFEPRLAGYFRAIGEDAWLSSVIVDGIERPERRPEAIAALDAVARDRTTGGLAPQMAGLFGLLGAADQTLDMLAREQDSIDYLASPVFDFVRDDPRFPAHRHAAFLRAPGPQDEEERGEGRPR
jgi:TolB-like protein